MCVLGTCKLHGTMFGCLKELDARSVHKWCNTSVYLYVCSHKDVCVCVCTLHIHTYVRVDIIGVCSCVKHTHARPKYSVLKSVCT